MIDFFDELPTWKKIAVAVPIIAVIVGVLVFFLSYRYEDTGTVIERRWYYNLSVRYNYTTCSPESHTTCTGSGSKRICTTTTEIECTSHTATRCETGLTGTEMPVVRPEVGCFMFPGDYLSDTVWYQVKYQGDGEEVKTSTLYDVSLWDILEPHRVVKLTHNSLGMTIGAEPVK